MLYGYKILVYCTSKIDYENFSDFISALNIELIKHNWRILVFCTDSDLHSQTKNKDGERDFFNLINFNVADALLVSNRYILDDELKSNLVRQAKIRNIPAIFIAANNPDAYNINFNQRSGLGKIITHVIKHHRIRDLHFMAGSENSIESEERLEIFKNTLSKFNIPFDKETMVSYGDFWDVPAKSATEKLLAREKIPKAIICANDTMAISVTSVLKEKGFYCPEDVIVTGFDGIPSIHFTTPKISSIVCDAKRLGYETATFLLDIVKNPQKAPYNKDIEPTMFISESCGCMAKQPANTLNYLNYLKDCYRRYRVEDAALNNMTVSIHDCKDITEVIAKLKNKLLYNVMCLVKADFIVAQSNPNIPMTKSVYGDTMFVIADSDNEEYIDLPLEQHFIKTKDYIPRMKQILTSYSYPLIFTPIHNSDLSIGYLCFFFKNYEKQNYTKVTQIASWMGNALSGYRNMQYQRYLQTKLEKMYQYDTLTGLFNRNGFIHTYNKIMGDKNVTTLTMVMCDLDNLKHINDNFSHNEGDNAICIVGKALSKGVGNVVSGGYYCRYGGDEIIGIFPTEVSADLIKEQLNAFIDSYNITSNKPYKVSTSVGVVTSPKATFEELFAKADKLMYEEKVTKKHCRKN
ncbi:MAG: GGDEF domain-containing protein [Treponema sp.]|nr:GGDEF domain-containing protein [Treponema sp.]